jgi:hypothetical protein
MCEAPLRRRRRAVQAPTLRRLTILSSPADGGWRSQPEYVRCNEGLGCTPKSVGRANRVLENTLSLATASAGAAQRGASIRHFGWKPCWPGNRARLDAQGEWWASEPRQRAAARLGDGQRRCHTVPHGERPQRVAMVGSSRCASPRRPWRAASVTRQRMAGNAHSLRCYCFARHELTKLLPNVGVNLRAEAAGRSASS